MSTSIDGTVTYAPDTSTDAFAERVFEASLGFIDVMSITLGDQLGWYDALARHPAMTAGRQGTPTGTDARPSPAGAAAPAGARAPGDSRSGARPPLRQG